MKLEGKPKLRGAAVVAGLSHTQEVRSSNLFPATNALEGEEGKEIRVRDREAKKRHDAETHAGLGCSDPNSG